MRFINFDPHVPHDSRRWLDAFNEAGNGTSSPDMRSIKALRKLIFSQTLEAIWYFHNDLAEVSTRLLGPDLLSVHRDGTSSLSSVEVVNGDILDEAEKMIGLGFSVAVLNMACASRAGGGVWSGHGAQEENLHRRSDLSRFLYEQQDLLYPIPRQHCLLSRGVTILRGSEQEGYPFFERERRSFRVSVISCAAYRVRWDSDPDQVDMIMAEKVALIVAAAVQDGCEVLLLSAFGCGAYGNSPERVARLFRSELMRHPFTKVVFCILDDHNSRGNFNAFQDVFH